MKKVIGVVGIVAGVGFVGFISWMNCQSCAFNQEQILGALSAILNIVGSK